MSKFSYDGKDFGDLLGVRHVGWSVLPPQQITDVQIVGRAGTAFTGRADDAQKLAVDVVVHPTEERGYVEQIREVAKHLRRKKPAPLAFEVYPGWHIGAIVTGDTDLDTMAAIGTGTVNFYCPDPAWYLDDDDVWDIDTSGSLAIPDQTRSGNDESFPLVRLNATSSGGTGNTLTFTLNDTSTTFHGRLDEGDELFLDSNWLTAYVVDTQNNRRSAINGLDELTFPVTVPGTNTLGLAVTGDAEVSAVHVECRSRSV